MFNIRKAAELGWEFAGAPQAGDLGRLRDVGLLMEGLRRTGGWSLLLSILPFTLYPLFADSNWLGPLKGQQSSPSRPPAYHMLSVREPAGHSGAGLRRDRDRLPGLRRR
jgi:hypothetical protein